MFPFSSISTILKVSKENKLKGDRRVSGVVTKMNKQKNRYTPFSGKYRMPVDEFCYKYGLNLKVVMRRMNVLYWEDFDSLVIPTELGDTSADKIRRSLMLLQNGWDKEKICDRTGVTAETLEKINNLSDYLKNIFLGMENFFFIEPKKVDLDKIFKEVN